MDSTLKILQDAQRLLMAGNNAAALPLLLNVLERADCPLAAMLQLVDIEIEQKQASVAIAQLRGWVAQHGASDEIDFMWAKAELALGQRDEARQRLLALHQRLPAATPSAPLAALIAMIEMQRDVAEAIFWWREAVRITPGNDQYQRQLSQALLQQGEAVEALEIAQHAVKLDEQKSESWNLLGEIFARGNETGEAIRCMKKCVEINPDQPAIWKRISHMHLELWQFDEAIETVTRAALTPDIDVDLLLGHAKAELGDCDGALLHYQHAVTHFKVNLPALCGERLHLKQVYDNAADVATYRARYTNGMAALLQQAGALKDQAADVFTLERTNFLLAYQGQDDLDLQQQYASLLGHFADIATPQWRKPIANTFDGARRLRIGFYGSLFRICTAGHYFEKWVTSLDPAHFECIVYHAAPLTDALTNRVAASCAKFVPLRLNTMSVAAHIAADNLDVLVYPEVGMDAATCLLSSLRLAPVQCAGWGHPVTTGSANIDYFITCDTMEPADAASHYREQLIRLPGLGVDYAMPVVDVGATRAQFGLSEDARLYFCPQSLFKIHPDMDALFADIVERDEHANIILFQGTSLHVTRALGKRIQRYFDQRGIPPRKQLKFLPRMNVAQFRQALTLADVVLDTVHWSGGNTSLDAFAAGVPVVTMPGQFMRGRQTMAMLQMMGQDELIVTSSEQYLDLAIKIAHDKIYRETLQNLIINNRKQLFNQPTPLQALADNLIKIAIHHRTTP